MAEIACNSARVWCTLVSLSSLANVLFQRKLAKISLSNQGCSFTLHLIQCDCRLLRIWVVPHPLPTAVISHTLPSSQPSDCVAVGQNGSAFCSEGKQIFLFLALFSAFSFFFFFLSCGGWIFVGAANRANSTCSCVTTGASVNVGVGTHSWAKRLVWSGPR